MGAISNDMEVLMASTMTTLDDLFARYYEICVTEALNDVFVETEVVETEVDPETIAIDTLAERVLASKLNRSLSQVNLETETLGFGIEFKGFRLYWYGRGLSLLILVLTLGSDLVRVFMAALLSTQ
jgi:hypothetical protein